MCTKTEQMYEGKAKKVFGTDNADYCIVSYKDDATAFNGQKKGSILGKGVVNNRLSNFLMSRLENKGVPTHFVKELSERDTMVKRVDIVPLEVIIRNRAAGSFSKKYGVEEGVILARPVLEFSYKNDDLGDPMISESHIYALELATEQEIEVIKNYALKVNEFLKETFLKADLEIIDFKIEFGRLPSGEIILADEISPDTCRLWDVHTGEKMDKDRFRRDMGGVEEAYMEVALRMMGE